MTLHQEPHSSRGADAAPTLVDVGLAILKVELNGSYSIVAYAVRLYIHVYIGIHRYIHIYLYIYLNELGNFRMLMVVGLAILKVELNGSYSIVAYAVSIYIYPHICIYI